MLWGHVRLHVLAWLACPLNEVANGVSWCSATRNWDGPGGLTAFLIPGYWMEHNWRSPLDAKNCNDSILIIVFVYTATPGRLSEDGKKWSSAFLQEEKHHDFKHLLANRGMLSVSTYSGRQWGRPQLWRNIVLRSFDATLVVKISGASLELG